jgi:hypothetical protein
MEQPIITMKKLLLLLYVSFGLSGCYWFDEFSNKCDEESALWGKASSGESGPHDNCNRLRFQYYNVGTTIAGVNLRGILGLTGDGPKEVILSFELITGEDIRDYEFRRPLKLSYDAETLGVRVDNPDFIASFDPGFSNTRIEKLDIEIDQKRRDKENYQGSIKCEGTHFKNINLDGSSNYVPFKLDLKFDTDNK